MKSWLLLISSLPTENATARMRAWRTLKGSGAAVLRDGVYVLPELPACRSVLEAVAADITGHGGNAFLFSTGDSPGPAPENYFDRRTDYAALLHEIHAIRNSLTIDTTMETTRQIRKLRKAFAAISEVDFFPGEAKDYANAAIQELELAVNRFLSPHEPNATPGDIGHLKRTDYQGRTWATRCRPWVDRLASAWLIRRFIDKDATILWLKHPSDCPKDALGFDFDGATFTHVGAKVTFEVLMASFGLDPPGLQRIAALVHYLDVGGIQPPESVGIESVLAGLRDTVQDDDQLLALANGVFDGLLANYGKALSK